MRFRYSIDFRCGIAVFADFFRGIAVLGTPQCPPPPTRAKCRCPSSLVFQAARAHHADIERTALAPS